MRCTFTASSRPRVYSSRRRAALLRISGSFFCARNFKALQITFACRIVAKIYIYIYTRDRKEFSYFSLYASISLSSSSSSRDFRNRQYLRSQLGRFFSFFFDQVEPSFARVQIARITEYSLYRTRRGSKIVISISLYVTKCRGTSVEDYREELK